MPKVPGSNEIVSPARARVLMRLRAQRHEGPQPQENEPQKLEATAPPTVSKAQDDSKTVGWQPKGNEEAAQSGASGGDQFRGRGVTPLQLVILSGGAFGVAAQLAGMSFNSAMGLSADLKENVDDTTFGIHAAEPGTFKNSGYTVNSENPDQMIRAVEAAIQEVEEAKLPEDVNRDLVGELSFAKSQLELMPTSIERFTEEGSAQASHMLTLYLNASDALDDAKKADKADNVGQAAKMVLGAAGAVGGASLSRRLWKDAEVAEAALKDKQS